MPPLLGDQISTPDDGRLAARIAGCPGQPTHVLESDQQAEHIPGCNMAFQRMRWNKSMVSIRSFAKQATTWMFVGATASRASGSLSRRRVRVASPSAGTRHIPQTTGRLWRGRGTAAIQDTQSNSIAEGTEVARGTIRHELAGRAIRPPADLSRYVWFRHVSMPLPTGCVSLGYAADRT